LWWSLCPGLTWKCFILITCWFRKTHSEERQSSLKNKIFGFRDNSQPCGRSGWICGGWVVHCRWPVVGEVVWFCCVCCETTKWGEKDFKFGSFIWLIEYGFVVYKFLDVMNLVMCSCMNRYMLVYMLVYCDKTKVSVTDNTCSKCVW